MRKILFTLSFLALANSAQAEWTYLEVPKEWYRNGNFSCHAINTTAEPKTIWVEFVELTNDGTVTGQQHPCMNVRNGEVCSVTTYDRRAGRCRVAWAGSPSDIAILIDKRSEP